MSRFVIIPNPNPNAAIWEIVLGSKDLHAPTPNNKFIVELPPDEHEDQHPALNGFPSFSHAEILEELKKPEYQITNI